MMDILILGMTGSIWVLLAAVLFRSRYLLNRMEEMQSTTNKNLNKIAEAIGEINDYLEDADELSEATYRSLQSLKVSSMVSFKSVLVSNEDYENAAKIDQIIKMIIDNERRGMEDRDEQD